LKYIGLCQVGSNSHTLHTSLTRNDFSVFLSVLSSACAIRTMQAIHQQVDQLCLPPTNPSASASLTQALNPAAPAGAVQQLTALLNRNLLSYWRNPSVNLSRFAVTLLMAVIVGSIEWGKGK
jgi:hypothetical protein